MSVNTELSALLTKMGGTPLESDSNSDLIKKISNAYEGGGVSSYNDLTDRPFDVTNENTTLVNGTITTSENPRFGAMGVLSYTQFIDAEIIEVTFNGVKYLCNKNSADGSTVAYGGYTSDSPDFSEYPFIIFSEPNDGNIIVTEIPGDYNIKIEEPDETVTTTEDFDKAVASTAYCILNVVAEIEDGLTTKRLDKAASEITEMASHLPVFICDSTESIVGYNNIIWCPCRIRCSSDDESYSFEIASSWSASFADMHFTADSPNAYPILRQEE